MSRLENIDWSLYCGLRPVLNWRPGNSGRGGERIRTARYGDWAYKVVLQPKHRRHYTILVVGTLVAPPWENPAGWGPVPGTIPETRPAYTFPVQRVISPVLCWVEKLIPLPDLVLLTQAWPTKKKKVGSGGEGDEAEPASRSL